MLLLTLTSLMKLHKLLKYFFLIFFLVNANIKLYSQEIRGLYINKFYKIITNKEKTDELLEYAKKHNFNYLLLYSTRTIDKQIFSLKDSLASLPLANFIYRAKNKYGIKQIGAIREGFDGFINLLAYNNIYKNNPLKKIDVFNLEFEFWNKTLIKKSYCKDELRPLYFGCSRRIAFKYYIYNLKKLYKLCQQNNLICETYIGHPTKSQSKKLINYCDRILVHYYRPTDVFDDGTSIYNYIKKRLYYLSAKRNIKVIPIFSATQQSMFKWLLKNSLDKPYNTYMNGDNGFNYEKKHLKKRVSIMGYQWFTYSDLLKIDSIKKSN